MSHLDLERLTVMVVEDSMFVRSLIVSSLKLIGVGQVVAKEHGGEAIELMKLIAVDPMLAGVQGIDIIFSNWEMSPVDGMMLLRWIRRHKESPDRFIPFVMMTAYSDRERVTEARDMGVTEFTYKPFTVTALAERLISIIERPRQFVHTRTYFGPDRRRQQLFADFSERRKLTDKSPEVEVIYG
ncbi:MAG: response regulator [Rhodothalassiaceae bacterium]